MPAVTVVISADFHFLQSTLNELVNELCERIYLALFMYVIQLSFNTI